MNVTTGKACLFMKSDKNNSDNLEILQLEDCFSGLSESVVRSVRFCRHYLLIFRKCFSA